MIGDATHDMTMALNAGVRAQGVSWGFATRDEIAESGSHHIADDFAELDVALDGFAARLAA
jgi:phosphoglycolate phosphatase